MTTADKVSVVQYGYCLQTMIHRLSYNTLKQIKPGFKTYFFIE